MFCKKCGTQLGQNDRFCPGCGASTAEAPAAYAAPALGDPLLAQRRNPLFLAAVICESAMAVFTLINLFAVLGSFGMVGSYMSVMGVDRDVARMTSSMIDTMSIFVTVAVLGSLAIMAVILTGLWMTYASGLSRGKPSTLVRGLKLVRGGVLAEMVYMIVGLSLMALGCLLLVSVGGMMNASYDSYTYYPHYAEGKAAAGLLTTMGLVILLFVAVLGVLMVIFYVKARRTVGFALDTAQTGKVTGLPSMYLAVMCFIIGGFSLLSLFLGSAQVLNVISTLVSAASYILFGIVALQYRSKAAAQPTA